MIIVFFISFVVIPCIYSLPRSKLKFAFDGPTMNKVGLLTDPTMKFTWRAPRETQLFLHSLRGLCFEVSDLYHISQSS